MNNASSISVRVYYEDTDFSGVVYHAAYLKFFERGRTEALRAVGVTHTALMGCAEPLVFAVRKMTVEWVAPARIDDMLTVRTQFNGVKGARMFLDQDMVRDETLVSRAKVEAVCLSTNGRPRRLPEAITRLFAS